MTIFRKKKLKKQLEELTFKSGYAVSRMIDYMHDADSTEWKQWAVLNSLYLSEMIKIKTQLES